MGLNKEAIKIGFAYVGIVVGAGFSTGQESVKHQLKVAKALLKDNESK